MPGLSALFDDRFHLAHEQWWETAQNREKVKGSCVRRNPISQPSLDCFQKNLRNPVLEDQE